MYAILILIVSILNFYYFIVIASVIMSWLVGFNILNYSTPLVKSVYDFLHQLTEPAFAFVRRVLPVMGGIDLSPIVIILGLHFLINFVGLDISIALLGRPII